MRRAVSAQKGLGHERGMSAALINTRLTLREETGCQQSYIFITQLVLTCFTRSLGSIPVIEKCSLL